MDLLYLLQNIKNSVNTMNLHGLMCTNAVVQAVLGIKGNSILLEANVRVIVSKPE